MKNLQKVGTVVGSTAILIIVGGFLLPSNLHIEVSRKVAQSPSRVFTIVSDFDSWRGWSHDAMNVPSPEDIAIETDSAGKAIRMIYMSRTDTSRIWERRIVKSPPNSAVFIRVLRGNHIVGEEQFHFQKTSVDTEKEATLITITYHEYLGFNPVERWLGLYFKYSLTRNYESDLERLELAALHRTLK